MPADTHPDANRADRRRSATTLVMVAVVMAAIVGVGLVLGNALLTPDDQPPPSPAATTTTADPKAEVEAAYRAFVAMVNRLDQAPDPNDPEIAQRTTGKSFQTFKRSLTKLKAAGQIINTGPQDKQTIDSIAIHGDTATVAVCYVDHAGVLDATSGAVVEPPTVTTTPVTVQLTRQAGMWLVSEVTPAGKEIAGASTCGR